MFSYLGRRSGSCLGLMLILRCWSLDIFLVMTLVSLFLIVFLFVVSIELWSFFLFFLSFHGLSSFFSNENSAMECSFCVYH